MPDKFLTAEWNNLIMANYVFDPPFNASSFLQKLTPG
jgi:hypothetical protein